MSSCSTIIRSAARCRTAMRGRQSEPRGRSVRAGASLRRRRRLPGPGADGQGAAQRAARRCRQPDLLSMLDLVALATVCDVVPLTGVNRAFVVKGLHGDPPAEAMPGLAALARVSRIGEPINTFHLGFLIGPRINAGGRIGDAALGSRLLATDDPVEAGTDRRDARPAEPGAAGDGAGDAGRGARRGRCRACRRRGPAVIVTASHELASRHRRPARLAAEGPCAPAGLRHRLQCQRRRHRLGPLGAGLRSRPAGARGRRCAG